MCHYVGYWQIRSYITATMMALLLSKSLQNRNSPLHQQTQHRCRTKVFVFFIIVSRVGSSIPQKQQFSPCTISNPLPKGFKTEQFSFKKTVSLSTKVHNSILVQSSFNADVVFSVILTKASQCEFYHVLFGTRNFLSAIS